ncbi:MAG: hypothetical protein ACN4GM_06495 [Gammaproteobacteria bacterium]
MPKNNVLIIVSMFLFLNITTSYAVPLVTGDPVYTQHFGVINWPQDEPTTTPFLTQLAANDINDLHGDVSCDLSISTPGNYHMALKDAMKGRPDLGHIGLQQQLRLTTNANVSVCWSTSPPISENQIITEKLQFKNINLIGLPALVVAPGSVMDQLIADKAVRVPSVMPLLTNRGNVILIRSSAKASIHNICDLGGTTRVVTPNPILEPGSFSNFSGTIFNVADKNYFGCDATTLFNSIFSQDISLFDLTAFDSPYKINRIKSVFGRGSSPQGTGAKWVASSRIMHRDIPYTLCNDQADAAVIFYHLAVYLKSTLAPSKCKLNILPLGGTELDPQPIPGNKIATLKIAKVKGVFSPEVKKARNIIYDFLTTSPIWIQILEDHGMMQ